MWALKSLGSRQEARERGGPGSESRVLEQCLLSTRVSPANLEAKRFGCPRVYEVMTDCNPVHGNVLLVLKICTLIMDRHCIGFVENGSALVESIGTLTRSGT